MPILILTNGDSAADLLRDAGVEAVIAPWRDALHSGPTPLVDDEKFVDVRAKHLADGEVNTVDEIKAGMIERNKLIDDHQNYDRIELWFEHDLYDQLQLIQIVSMLAERTRLENVALIQALSYLGMQTPDTILRFRDLTIPLEPVMYETAVRVWNAFRSDTPEELYAEAGKKTPGFPVLQQAIKRALQELPGYDGLSRTERQILYSIRRGVSRTGMLFARVNNMEEAAFLGDWRFFDILSGLAYCRSPLITGLPEKFVPSLLQDDERRKAFITSEISLTKLGESVLDGEQDHAEHNEINRWLGGSHITNGSLWRWDDEKEHLITPR